MLKAQRQLGRVLVVEDHAPLRKAIAALLANSGAEVLEAETEREAVALLDPPPEATFAPRRLGPLLRDLLESGPPSAPIDVGI